MIALGREGNLYDGSEVGLPDLLESYDEWDELKSIAVVECERAVGGETTLFRRSFITSLGLDAKGIAESGRDHWGIENSFHWVLDVVWPTA